MHVVATEAAATKLARLVLSIEKPSCLEVIENRNFASELSEEEISIFLSLPQSQRHPDYKKKNRKTTEEK